MEFSFTVQIDTAEGETVCVVGDCPELGNWVPHNALCLKKISESDTGELWSNTVKISSDVIEYRYFVCVLLDYETDHGEVIVRRWETHLTPRLLGVEGQRATPIERFGFFGNTWHVESGWLTAESVVQMKFYNNPIQIWKQQYANKLFYVKVSPVDLERKDSMQTVDDDDDYNYQHSPPTVTWPLVEIAVMNDLECDFQMQQQFGHVYHPDDFIVFKAQMLRPETIKLLHKCNGSKLVDVRLRLQASMSMMADTLQFLVTVPA